MNMGCDKSLCWPFITPFYIMVCVCACVCFFSLLFLYLYHATYIPFFSNVNHVYPHIVFCCCFLFTVQKNYAKLKLLAEVQLFKNGISICWAKKAIRGDYNGMCFLSPFEHHKTANVRFNERLNYEHCTSMVIVCLRLG